MRDYRKLEPKRVATARAMSRLLAAAGGDMKELKKNFHIYFEQVYAPKQETVEVFAPAEQGAVPAAGGGA